MESTVTDNLSNNLNPGQTLKVWRLRLGITQEDLSYGICSPARYSRIESGQEHPTREEFSLLMEKMHESGLDYSDLYIDPISDQFAVMLVLQNESHLDHWEKVSDIVSRYSGQHQKMSPNEMQLISFFALMSDYNMNDTFRGLTLCENAYTILKFTQPSISRDIGQIDFIPTTIELMLFNAIACGMIETHQEVLYRRAIELIGQLICVEKRRNSLFYQREALICLLVNLGFFEYSHGDLAEARRHLDMIPAFFTSSGGFYLFCKDLRCEYYYYKRCGLNERCTEIVSMIRYLFSKIPNPPSFSTFMKNSPKIMVF
ncbi:MAG: helix-turn-helix transcriptional regulator [bacterium LCO1.1]|uniref:Helix-turn-helix transcriptional regulator n=1 Tax=Candidatus Weimeria bifida TaxID=2599074 RepID=A0A6N7J0A4_9FIRM|nr:helix-turn-helix transcriptional regulator [Candidatus Weimeria bifida]